MLFLSSVIFLLTFLHTKFKISLLHPKPVFPSPIFTLGEARQPYPIFEIAFFGFLRYMIGVLGKKAALNRFKCGFYCVYLWQAPLLRGVGRSAHKKPAPGGSGAGVVLWVSLVDCYFHLGSGSAAWLTVKAAYLPINKVSWASEKWVVVL